MWTRLDFNDFRDMFGNVRPNSFSYDGLEALFEFLEEIDPEYELDVIDLDSRYYQITEWDVLNRPEHYEMMADAMRDYVEEMGDYDNGDKIYEFSDLDLDEIVNDNFNVVAVTSNPDTWIVENK